MAKHWYPQRKLLHFVNWHSGESSKIGQFSRKYNDWKIEVIKNAFYKKKGSPKLLIYQMKKKKQEEFIDVWHGILTLIIRFWLFLRTHINVDLQNTIISFEDINFWPKIFPIFVSLLKIRQPILPEYDMSSMIFHPSNWHCDLSLQYCY